jgi:hypothetical protein
MYVIYDKTFSMGENHKMLVLEHCCLLFKSSAKLLFLMFLLVNLNHCDHAGKENMPFHLSIGKACSQKMVDSVMVELSS